MTCFEDSQGLIIEQMGLKKRRHIGGKVAIRKLERKKREGIRPSKATKEERHIRNKNEDEVR